MKFLNASTLKIALPALLVGALVLGHPNAVRAQHRGAGGAGTGGGSRGSSGGQNFSGQRGGGSSFSGQRGSGGQPFSGQQNSGGQNFSAQRNFCACSNRIG